MDPKIKSTVWDDDDFTRLDDGCRVLFFWLITCQGTNNIGYVEVSNRALKVDTGRDSDGLVSLLKALPRSYVWDEQNGRVRVWIRNYVKHQWPAGMLTPRSNMFSHLRNLYMALPEPFRMAFEGAYPSLARGFQGVEMLEGASKGLASPQNRTEPHRSDQKRSSQGDPRGGGDEMGTRGARPSSGETTGSLCEWPTLAEWTAAGSMEGLTAAQITKEWAYQERKVPAERWKGIDPARLRHHAAYVREQARPRVGSEKTAQKNPGAEGAAGMVVKAI